MNNDADDREADLVPLHAGCPNCRERDCDRLVWIDDDRVHCQVCGIVYRPKTGQAKSPEGGDDAGPA